MESCRLRSFRLQKQAPIRRHYLGVSILNQSVYKRGARAVWTVRAHLSVDGKVGPSRDSALTGLNHAQYIKLIFVLLNTSSATVGECAADTLSGTDAEQCHIRSDIFFCCRPVLIRRAAFTLHFTPAPYQM